MRAANVFRALIAALLFASCLGGGAASQEAAATVDLSVFNLPAETPPPVPLRLEDTERCLASECDGTDPVATQCEADAYTLGPPIPIVGDEGYPTGTLELRGSHNKCDSTQWAQAHLTEPTTFALRVRQCETGLATEWREFTDYEGTAQSAQFSSPELCVWPELAVPDDTAEGGWRVIAAGWPDGEF